MVLCLPMVWCGAVASAQEGGVVLCLPVVRCGGLSAGGWCGGMPTNGAKMLWLARTNGGVGTAVVWPQWRGSTHSIVYRYSLLALVCTLHTGWYCWLGR